MTRTGRPAGKLYPHQVAVGFTHEQMKWIDVQRGIASVSAYIRSIIEKEIKGE